MRFRVVIVDDDESVRNALKMSMTRSSHLLCAGSFPDGKEGLRGIVDLRPDIVFMDIRMPGMSGIECTHKLKLLLPQTQIIMHTAADDRESVLRSLMAGADGYLVKSDSSIDFVEAIQKAVQGEPLFSNSVLKQVVEAFHHVQGATPAGMKLSWREQEIMPFLFQQYRDKEIANSLHVAGRTIQTHVYRILRKLKARNRSKAIEKFLGLRSKPKLRPVARTS